MLLQIDWAEPILKGEDVLKLRTSDLDAFYASAAEVDRLDLFFILLASFHHYLDENETQKAAHLSFLMAYYLFTPLTPPGSYELALHYIRQAISLNPLKAYKEWLPLIERGN